ncbi:MAG: four helix bundle protein [Pyrinomonadaceae bacterium]
MDNGKLKTESVLRSKSFAFGLRSVKLYKFLANEHHEYVLSKQVLRSGTSIGANIVEVSQAQSKPDFIHKLSISLKEAFETEYWILLLREGEYLPADHADSMLTDCCELQKILTASIKTARSRSR